MSLGRFGKAFLDSLEENRPETYASLEAKGELSQMAKEVDEQANQQFETVLAHLQKQHPLPTSHPERAGALRGLASQAEELVMSELLAMDEETETASVHGYAEQEPSNPLRLRPISLRTPETRGAAPTKFRPPPSQ